MLFFTRCIMSLGTRILSSLATESVIFWSFGDKLQFKKHIEKRLQRQISAYMEDKR